MMADAGVDTSTFHQHSTSSASAAWLRSGTNKNLSLAQICHQGQWYRATTTFRKFYNRVDLHTKEDRAALNSGPGVGGMWLNKQYFLNPNYNQVTQLAKLLLCSCQLREFCCYFPVSGELAPLGKITIWILWEEFYFHDDCLAVIANNSPWSRYPPLLWAVHSLHLPVCQKSGKGTLAHLSLL